MCHIILMMPILALPLFRVLPLSLAAPVYGVILRQHLPCTVNTQVHYGVDIDGAATHLSVCAAVLQILLYQSHHGQSAL